MSWSIGYDDNWHRDVGYGVPATCDHPRCGAKIDRGLGHICGNGPYGGDNGCGLFFCDKHGGGILCERCSDKEDGGDGEVEPFIATPDVPEWINHKLADPSWKQWRDENPEEVEAWHEMVKI